MTEKRFGHFQDFYGDLFVRAYDGIRECRKYNYIKDRWILEKFTPGYNPEIQDDYGGTYEPFFVFESAKGEYLPPTIKVVQFIVYMARHRVVTTAAERKEIMEAAEEQELKEFLGKLEEVGRSPIESLLETGEGVSLYTPSKENQAFWAKIMAEEVKKKDGTS